MDIELFKKRNNFYNELKNNSVNIETDDFINEWEFSNYYSDEKKCICKHNIENIFVIKNLLNNKKLTVGSDCIKKFMINNELLKDTVESILKANIHIKKFNDIKLEKTKHNNKTFKEVYINDKNYTKFIKELDTLKNPILIKFRNYIHYSDLLKKYNKNN